MIARIQIQDPHETRAGNDTFLGHITGNRKLIVTMLVGKLLDKCQKIDKWIPLDKCTYELVSMKAKEDKSSSFQFSNVTTMELFYVLVKGPSTRPVSMQNIFDKYGDFSQLSTRKCVSRLELFQSPGSKYSDGSYVKEFPIDYFEDIQETGHEGCGFINEEFLWDLIGRNKDGLPNAAAKRSICIQIRAFIPMLGIYKGMLMKKQMGKGCPKIQLPPSMKKVEKSMNPKRSEQESGYLLINKAGKDPSSYNIDMDKLINNISVLRAKFEVKKQSKMIERLVKSCCVQPNVVETYFKSCYSDKKKVCHAFVRGVCVSHYSLSSPVATNVLHFSHV